MWPLSSALPSCHRSRISSPTSSGASFKRGATCDGSAVTDRCSDDSYDPAAHAPACVTSLGGVRASRKVLPICAEFPRITTCSEAMMRLLSEASKFARSSGCILIQGESGTGKELMASSLHRLSPRSGKAMVTMNCSAIPEGLLESELFGHVKGAFTGADRHKEGFFAEARGGTLFLDEIGDMPLRLQAKLLRVLQNNTYHPVGSTQLHRSDVRIIAATNIDLSAAVQRKKFRLDLYYRLNILPIELLPLRRRAEDIDLLVEELTRGANKTSGCQCFFSPSCIERMRLYPWPGNIRELENLITRLVLTKGEGMIEVTDLPPRYLQEDLFPLREGASYHDHAPRIPPLFTQFTQSTQQRQALCSEHLGEPGSMIGRSRDTHASDTHARYSTGAGDAIGEEVSVVRSAEVSQEITPLEPRDQDYLLSDIISQISLPAGGISMTRELKKLEKHLITKALAMTGNNKNKAASLLGMKRTTLVEKMKRYDGAPAESSSSASASVVSSRVDVSAKAVPSAFGVHGVTHENIPMTGSMGVERFY